MRNPWVLLWSRFDLGFGFMRIVEEPVGFVRNGRPPIFMRAQRIALQCSQVLGRVGLCSMVRDECNATGKNHVVNAPACVGFALPRW